MREESVKGSIELKTNLPYGSLKEISEVFGYRGTTWASRVISGKETGSLLLIECAVRIAAAYENSGFTEAKNKILNDYGNFDRSRT